MQLIFSTDPIKSPLTGIGRYTHQLAQQLVRRREIARILFSHGRKLLNHVPEPQRSAAAISDLRDGFSKYALLTDAYRKTRSFAKAHSIRHQAEAIYHGTNYYLPKFAGRSVVTIHDISAFSLADCHRPDRVRYMQKEMQLTLARASIIITVSEFSKREIVARFGWPAERIHVTPLASAQFFHPRPVVELTPVLRTFGLRAGHYCLYVGTIEPRKNLGVLFDAYRRLPQPLRTRFPLVLAGDPGWNSETLHAHIQDARREGWLHYLGFVEDSLLPALFAGARLFAFPSLYEGFGLPVLEAMASGVPVVCSNTSSLPEVAGNAAAMFSPFDVERLTSLIVTGLEDEHWRSTASECGLRQAAGFGWERCADLTLNAYTAALSA